MPDIAITLTQAEPVNLDFTTPEINLTLLNGADVRTYLDSLSEYTSDQAAIDDGLSVGDWYVCADGHESAASGTLKKIR
jgi:hypothetical protein